MEWRLGVYLLRGRWEGGAFQRQGPTHQPLVPGMSLEVGCTCGAGAITVTLGCLWPLGIVKVELIPSPGV